jgi:hypothetical protein
MSNPTLRDALERWGTRIENKEETIAEMARFSLIVAAKDDGDKTTAYVAEIEKTTTSLKSDYVVIACLEKAIKREDEEIQRRLASERYGEDGGRKPKHPWDGKIGPG